MKLQDSPEGWERLRERDARAREQRSRQRRLRPPVSAPVLVPLTLEEELDQRQRQAALRRRCALAFSALAAGGLVWWLLHDRDGFSPKIDYDATRPVTRQDGAEGPRIEWKSWQNWREKATRDARERGESPPPGSQ